MYLLEFVLIFLGITFLQTGNITSILTVLDQTGKYANSLYLTLRLGGVGFDVLSKLTLLGKAIFCIVYFIQIFVRRKKEGKNYMYLMMLFILLAITNFRTWYIMWLFGIITELDTKNMWKVIALTIIAEFSNYIIYYLGEGYIFGGYYFLMTVITFALYCVGEKIYEKYIEVKKLSSAKGN